MVFRGKVFAFKLSNLYPYLKTVAYNKYKFDNI